MTTIYRLSLISLSVLMIILSEEHQAEAARKCSAGCSPNIMLPCDFGSLDQCHLEACKDACWKDNYRKMGACYCRGSPTGPTLRACFCGPSSRELSQNPEKVLFS